MHFLFGFLTKELGIAKIWRSLAQFSSQLFGNFFGWLISYSLKFLVKNFLGKFSKRSSGCSVPLFGFSQVCDDLILGAAHLVDLLAFALGHNTFAEYSLLGNFLLGQLGHPQLQGLQFVSLILLLLPCATVQTNHTVALFRRTLFPRHARDIATDKFVIAFIFNLHGFQFSPVVRVLCLTLNIASPNVIFNFVCMIAVQMVRLFVLVLRSSSLLPDHGLFKLILNVALNILHFCESVFLNFDY